MQHCDVLYWSVWIARIVQPGVCCIRVGMALEIKDFDYAIPHRLTLEYLFDGHTFAVRGLNTVELVNDGFKFFDVGHCLFAEKQTFECLFAELPLLYLRTIFKTKDASAFII